LERNRDKDKLVLYLFEGYDPSRSAWVKGSWWAVSSEQAQFWLRSQGYSDIRIRPDTTSCEQVRANPTALAHFYRQLAVMFRAGLPLTEALQVASHSEDRRLGGVALKICDLVETGFPLSGAMKTFPSVFDPIVVSLVHAAERTGRLVEVLSRLADRQEKADRLRRMATSALVYPAVVIGSTILLTLFFFMTVFPANQELLVSLHVEMPLPHRYLARLVEILNSPLTPVMLLALGGGMVVKLRSPDTRSIVRRRVLSFFAIVPAVEQLQSKARGLRFMEVLSLLLHGGGTVELALRQMIAASADEVERSRIRNVRRRLMEGEDFVEALSETGLLPPLVVSLLQVGQESGRLAAMAEKSAKMCEEDVELALETAGSVMEPLLLAVAGLIVGAGVMLTMAPVFTLLQGL